MKSMTWKEFKEAVDKAIADSGHDDSIEIWYIDITWPHEGDFANERMKAFADNVEGLVVQ